MPEPGSLGFLQETCERAGIPSDADPHGSLGRDGIALGETMALGEAAAGAAEPTSRSPVETLPELNVLERGATRRASPGEVEVIRTIGLGGMGRVDLAHQPGLDRRIAIKRVRAEAKSDARAHTLVREARLLGALEHPNIPPVYMLGRSDAEPVMAMKRIEGVAWSELLEDEVHPAWAEHDDRLARNLEILMQICQATHFAHVRGVLHLDIKPDNVMLGRFGEVFLIDWGVAHRIDEVAQAELGRVVGTPVYMAPEMVGGLTYATVATDVYLLGASLHEILMGQPPHDAPNVVASFHSVMASVPHQYPPRVDPELGAIANRACHVDPAERFGSAEELRQALWEFLRMRGSRALSDAAENRLEHLRTIIAESSEGAPVSSSVRSTFGQCSFAFDQALREAPHNERATQGRRDAYVLMIEAELEAGNAGAAEAQLLALDEPHPRLRQAIAQLRQHQARDADARVRLDAIEEDHRIRDDSWSRLIGHVIGTMSWLLCTCGLGYAARTGLFEVTPWHNLVVGVLWLAIGVGTPLLRRHEFFHNRVLKQMSVTIGAATMALFVNRVAAVVMDFPLLMTAISDLLVAALLLTYYELIFQKLLWGALISLAVLVGAIPMLLAPDYAYEILGVWIAVCNVSAGWSLRPELERLTKDVDEQRKSKQGAPQPARSREAS